MTKKDAMPYMKHYLSYLYDDDFTEIDRLTRSFYWDFYLLAWNADANGEILNRETGEPLSIERIAKKLYEDVSTVERALQGLREAGFIELSDNNTWKITRYSIEQDNQAAKRKAWRERQEKSRSGKQETEPNIKEDNGIEPNVIEPNVIEHNIIEHNIIELKSHTDVTRDSNVTIPPHGNNSIPEEEHSREQNTIPEVRESRQRMRDRFQACLNLQPAWNDNTWNEFDTWLIEQEAAGRTIERWSDWYLQDKFRKDKQLPNLKPAWIKQNWNLANGNGRTLTFEADGSFYG